MDLVTLALAKSYIDKKINEEGIVTGATPQQAAQIERNKTDIADLQAEIESKQPKGDYVKTVNGNKPDASGNVMVVTGGNGSGQNPPQAADLTGVQTILRNVMTIIRAQVEDTAGTPQAYNIDISGLAAECDALIAGLTGPGDESPDVPEQPTKTLTGISAVYSGGSVPVETAVAALTGVVVTAHYSDGSTAVVTGYSLSGSIAEGSNTITVSYGGMTATITVVGVAEESGLEQYEYTIAGSGNLDVNGGLFGGPYNYTDFIQIDPDYAAVTLAAYLPAPAESNTTVYSYIQWFNGDTFISRPDSMAYIEIGKVVAVRVNPVPAGATKFRISVQNNCKRFALYKGEVSAEGVA